MKSPLLQLTSTVMLPWELLLLLQILAFKIPAHLGLVTYTINIVVKHALALSLPALTSGFQTLFLFPVCAEDYDLVSLP